MPNKLSSRLRPNSECADWVIDAVKRLENENALMAANLSQAKERLDKQETTISAFANREQHWQLERQNLRAKLEMAQNAVRSADAEGLDARLKAAGMLSVAELLSGAPLDAFMAHAGVHDLASFLSWVAMRRAECLRLLAKYDLGDKPKDDELYEWAIAHSAVFGEVHVNLKKALASHQATPTIEIKTAELTGAALDWARQQPSSEQPKTFGCHHVAPVCGNCEWLVRQWLTRELGEVVRVPGHLAQ